MGEKNKKKKTTNIIVRLIFQVCSVMVPSSGTSNILQKHVKLLMQFRVLSLLIDKTDV